MVTTSVRKPHGQPTAKKRLPVAPSKFKFTQHGKCGRWVSELLPHTANHVDELAMINSVPGQTLSTPTGDDVAMFEPGRLVRYADTLRRLAIPYRVINRRPVRNTDVAPTQIDFAQGVVSSALDLAQFNMAYDNGFLAPATRVHALSQAFANGMPLRTGLGWFVQAYNNEPIAWQFGVVENAYSSLIVKVPNRRLTLILLANSDGLTAPFALEAGDVTTSIFARTFLQAFLP